MRKVAIGFLLGAFVGGIGTGAFLHVRSQREMASLVFLEGLAKIQSAATTLELMDSDGVDAARKINQMYLDSAIDGTYRMMVDFPPDTESIAVASMRENLNELLADLSDRQPDRRETLWLKEILDYIDESG